MEMKWKWKQYQENGVCLARWQDTQTIVCIIANKTNTKGSSFSTELVYFCIQMRTFWGSVWSPHEFSAQGN